MATKKEVTMPDGSVDSFWKIDGFTFRQEMIDIMMPAKDLELQLKWIKETEIKEDDVILCAFPKTGTHWTWEILNMILRGTSDYHKDTKMAAMLEFNTPELTSSLSSPRVLNTHLTHKFLPDGIIDKKCKIIHVMRNPKDVLVSYYHHMKVGTERVGAKKLPPFEMFAKMFRGELGEPFLCSYTWYIKTWEQFQAENPDYPLLNVFYEDLKKDSVGEIKKIATFLGKDIDDMTITAISDNCNFNKLKQAHEKKNDRMQSKMEGGTGFMYRKGTIGDWKNYLTVAENEQFDKWLERELKDSKIKFVYQ